MSPSVPERLGWRAFAGLSGRPADDRSAMAASAAFLFTAGALLGLVTLAVPGPGRNVPVLLAVAVVAVLASIVLVVGHDRLPAWYFHVSVAAGTVITTVAVAHSGSAFGGYVVFYVWIVLFACWFFPRGAAAAHVVWIAVCFAVAVAVGGGASGRWPAWLIAVGTLTITAVLVERVRTRMRRLIETLQDVARTDPLTGLPNRRGFEELFATELARAERTGRPLGVVIGDLDHFKDVNDRFGHGAGDEALERVSAVLRSVKRRIDTVARIGGEEFALLVPEADRHGACLLAERLRNEIKAAFAGEPVPLTMSFGVAAYPSHGETPERVLHAADQALYAAKELGRDRSVVHSAEVAELFADAARRRHGRVRRVDEDLQLSTVLELAEALDLRDSGTARHSQTVGAYAELMARELDFSEPAVERMRLAGVLHDIGKIGVSDTVLRKTAPLTAEEWEDIRRHPEIGARILSRPGLEDIRAWVLAHHERPDGKGYPFGLTAERIPLQARILAVADAYEAMTSDRPYRLAIGADEAAAELRRNAGTQFDANVVEAFLRALARRSGASRAAAAVA